MLSHLNKYQIILASQSPRRQNLLGGLGIPFKVETIEVEENYPENLSGEEIPLYLAQKKANAYCIQKDTMLITADTIVWLYGCVLGKPANETEAKKMLEVLSGKTHKVITGVCIRTTEKIKTFSSVSKVHFAALNKDEIDFYIDKYKPYDKAGAYGVQEWIGYIGVEYIQGSFYNIMGLPVQKLYSELKKWE